MTTHRRVERQEAVDAVRTMAKAAGVEDSPDKMVELMAQHLLRHAVSAGEEEALEQALKSKADINSPISDTSGGPAKLPLEIAVEHGHVKIAQALLEEGAVCTASQLVHAAARGGQEDMLLFLFSECGVNVAVRNKQGKNGVHVAVANNKPNMISLFCKDFGVDANLADIHGRSALHTACWKGHMKCTKELIQQGAQVNLCDEDGRTPLHLAALGSRVDCIRVLLENGADAFAQDMGGQNAAFLGTAQGHTQVVRVLFEMAGASAEDVARHAASVQGLSPLIHAAMQGNVDLVSVFREFGVPDPKNAEGKTALLVATEKKKARERSEKDLKEAAKKRAQQALLDKTKDLEEQQCRAKEKRCAVCGVECTASCSRCQSVFYCGAAHQRGHWKQHKKACAKK